MVKSLDSILRVKESHRFEERRDMIFGGFLNHFFFSVENRQLGRQEWRPEDQLVITTED